MLPSVRLRPLFALLTALSLGIATASVLPFSLPIPALLMGMAAVLMLSRLAARKNGDGAGNAAALLFAFFLFGMVRIGQSERIAADDISRLAGGPSVRVRGSVTSDVESRPSSFGSGVNYAFTLKTEEVDDYQSRRTASGRLRVAVFAAAAAPKPGDVLWVRGKIQRPLPATNPDAFDYREYLKRQGIHAVLAARREGDVRPVGSALLPPLMRAAAFLRSRVEQRISSHLSPNDAALLRGMLLSERSHLPIDLVDAFTRTGTVHILSVSGMHVAVIAALVIWILRTLTVPKKPAHLICIAAVWLFALAASGGGGNPPAFRAALCATVFFAAPLLRRDAEARHSLAFAALVLLAADPQTLFDPGAQLSFVTVGTILLWHPLLEQVLCPWEPGMPRLARLCRGINSALLLGFVAHLGSWPLSVFYFHQYSVVAPLSNLVISFLADALVVGGIVFSAAPFLPWWPIAQGLSLLRTLALSFAAPPWAAFSVAVLPAPLIISYYCLAGGLAAVARARFLTPKKFPSPFASGRTAGLASNPQSPEPKLHGRGS